MFFVTVDKPRSPYTFCIRLFKFLSSFYDPSDTHILAKQDRNKLKFSRNIFLCKGVYESRETEKIYLLILLPFSRDIGVG